MRLKLWGVRGSLPSPPTPAQIRRRLVDILEAYAREGAGQEPCAFVASLPSHRTGGFGGNTLCGEVTAGSSRLIIDGGSGLRGLSDALTIDAPDLKEHHIYFTHFHWDHVIGLPFFAPFYQEGRTVHCYAVHADLEANVRRMFTKPNFPVPFEAIASRVKFHRLEPRRRVTINGFDVTPYQLDHPDPCWGARIESAGKSIAWAVDTECARSSREEMGEDLGLYRDADLMVFDAQYTFGQALEKINWGHASGPIGIDVALREKIKSVLFVHHDPAASDEVIHQAEEQTRAYVEKIERAREHTGKIPPPLDWRFAREGAEVSLGDN